MKKISYILAALSITLLSFIKLQSSIWALDTIHSNLRFSVTSLQISEIEGTFKMTKSTITAQKEDFSDAVVLMTADASTIDTENTDRDTHLKSADFFDTAKYPAITFKSNRFEKTSENKYKVTGDLTMHGITKEIVLEAVARYGTHPMSKKTLAGFKVTGTIKRSDFGIASSTPVAMLNDEVSIVANAQYAKD
jgi:polyisoprenoid-binding protein YceI